MNDWQHGLNEGLEAMHQSLEVAMSGVRSALGGPDSFSQDGAKHGSGPTEYQFETGSHTHLSVELSEGTVHITGHEEPNVQVRAGSDSGITALEVEDGIRVEADRGRSRGRGNCSIRVPFGSPVTVKTHGGDVLLEKTLGPVSLTTVGGDIRVIGARGETFLSTKEGDVSVEDAEGTISASSTNGDLWFARIQGDLTAHTINGNNVINRSELGSLSAESTNGDIRAVFAPHASGSYRLVGVNGDISLTVPADAGIEVEASTVNGKITGQLEIEAESSTGRWLSGRRNGGGALFTLKTVGGDIGLYAETVRIDRVQPIPPIPAIEPAPAHTTDAPTAPESGGAVPQSTGLVSPDSDSTLSILGRLHAGELTVEDALQQLDALETA